MSTTIYDAFKVIEPSTFNLFDFQVLAQKKLVVPVVSENINRILVETFALLDVALYRKFNNRPANMAEFEAANIFAKNENHLTLSDFYKLAIRHSKDWDHLNKDRNAQFMFLRNPLNNDLYCLVHAAPEIIKRVRKFKMFEDYSYWNNTDRPDKVTKKEWKEREKNWEATIPRTLKAPYKLRHLSFKVMDENYETPGEWMLKDFPFSIPSDQSRLNRLIGTYLSDKYTEERPNLPTGQQFDIPAFLNYINDSDNREEASKAIIESGFKLAQYTMETFRAEVSSKEPILR